jgi:PTS system ascorbate-specific IIA component
MSVGVLVISHDDIGKSLLESAHAALGHSPLPTASVSASRDCDPEELLGHARAAAEALDAGEGVLVLTDLYGATPSNIAGRLRQDSRCPVRVVTGVNLPMLIRVLNYPKLDLDALCAKAVSGGKDGVFEIIDATRESP